MIVTKRAFRAHLIMPIRIENTYCYNNQNYLPPENKTLRHHNIPQLSQTKYLESNCCLFAFHMRKLKYLKQNKKDFFPFAVER